MFEHIDSVALHEAHCIGVTSKQTQRVLDDSLLGQAEARLSAHLGQITNELSRFDSLGRRQDVRYVRSVVVSFRFPYSYELALDVQSACFERLGCDARKHR